MDDVAVVLNYGLNKVRFPAPVKVGSRIRMHVTLAELTDMKNGVEAVYRLTYETEGEGQATLRRVADLVFRYYP